MNCKKTLVARKFLRLVKIEIKFCKIVFSKGHFQREYPLTLTSQPASLSNSGGTKNGQKMTKSRFLQIDSICIQDTSTTQFGHPEYDLTSNKGPTHNPEIRNFGFPRFPRGDPWGPKSENFRFFQIDSICI